MGDGLEIVQEKETLKECLEKRVAECVQNPKCIQRRIVVAVWDAQDKEADILGNKISQNAEIGWLRLHANADRKEQFQKEVKRYCQKVGQREVECENGIYFLFLYHQNRFWETFPYAEILKDALNVFSECKVENCRLMEENMLKTAGKTGKSEGEELQLTHFEWRMEKTENVTAELLLQKAKYDEELFSSIIKKDLIGVDSVALKTSECNAVREEFSKKFGRGIQKQTSGEANVKNKLKERLSIEKSMHSEVPDFTWLPLVGYEQLEADLREEMKQYPFFKRVLIWLRKESIRSKRSLRKILGQLFGGNGYGEVRTEYLRKKLETETVPKICQEALKREKETIREKVLTHFSLYDIIYTLPDLALSFRDESEEISRKVEREIPKMLEDRFYFKRADIARIYPDLAPYFAACRRFLQKRMECSWWELLAGYLQELKREIALDYENLCVAATVLKNSCIPQMQEPLEFEKSFAASDDKRILNEEELRQKMKLASSNARFQKSDFKKIVKAMEKHFTNQKDLDANLEKKPRLYMILSSEYRLEDHEIKEILESTGSMFQWGFVNSEFLSAKKIFQLRVYALSKGE